MGGYIDCISTKIKQNIGAIKRIKSSLPKEYHEMLSSSRSLGTATLYGDTVVTHYSTDFKLYKTEPRGSFHPQNMTTQIINIS